MSLAPTVSARPDTGDFHSHKVKSGNERRSPLCAMLADRSPYKTDCTDLRAVRLLKW